MFFLYLVFLFIEINVGHKTKMEMPSQTDQLWANIAKLQQERDGLTRQLQDDISLLQDELTHGRKARTGIAG